MRRHWVKAGRPPFWMPSRLAAGRFYLGLTSEEPTSECAYKRTHKYSRK